MIENFVHNGLKFEFVPGTRKTFFDKNTLVLNVYFKDWTLYQKVDICLDDTIVEVTVMGTENQYETIYLVYDYEVWNRRSFKDMSVIKNLERVGANKLKKADRHVINMDFGRSKLGKETLEKISKKIQTNFNVLDNGEQLVRIRNWDQSKDVIFKPYATKATIEAGQEVLEELVSFLQEEEFSKESTVLQEQLLKSLFEKVELTIDFKENFKKKK